MCIRDSSEAFFSHGIMSHPIVYIRSCVSLPANAMRCFLSLAKNWQLVRNVLQKQILSSSTTKSLAQSPLLAMLAAICIPGGEDYSVFRATAKKTF